MNVNKKFANHYNSYRRREELSHKLKEDKKKNKSFKNSKNKDSHSLSNINARIEKLTKTNKDRESVNGEESDSSDSSFEEEDISRMNRHADAILAALRSNDPKVLDGKIPEVTSSSDEEAEGEEDATEKKPVYLKDYERKFILEKGGVPEYSSSGEDDDEDNEADDQLLPLSSGLDHELQTAKPTSNSSSSSDSDNEDKDATNSANKPAASQEEWFPKDLFFFVPPPADEGDDRDDEPPTWDKVIPTPATIFKAYAAVERNFAKKYRLTKEMLEELRDSSDEEETGQDKAQHTVTGLRPAYRPQDVPHFASKGLPVPGKGMSRAEKRLLKRKARAAAKADTLAKLTEEKQLRMDELRERAQKIRRSCGKSGISLMEALREEYLDKDWDPQEHERLLMEMFGEEYYELDDDEVGDEKPVFTSDSEIDAITESDEAEVNMGDPDAEEVGLPSRKRRDRRHKKKTAKKKAEPVEEQQQQSTSATSSVYVNQDLVRDEKNQLRVCRFPYRRVKPINYGLSAEEILNADVKELNAWCSIKKVVGYRDEEEEEREARYFESTKMQKRKARLLPSLFQAKDEVEEKPPEKEAEEAPPESNGQPSQQKKKRPHRESETTGQEKSVKKTKKQRKEVLDRPMLSESRAAALGFNPKTYKYLPLDNKK